MHLVPIGARLRLREMLDLVYSTRLSMPQQYRVKQGDCISSIAAQFGHVFDTVWNYGDNADLKERRKDPNVLYPGDVVVIPDKTERLEDRGTDGHHKFTAKAAPTFIHLRLLLDDQPRAGLSYE